MLGIQLFSLGSDVGLKIRAIWPEKRWDVVLAWSGGSVAGFGFLVRRIFFRMLRFIAVAVRLEFGVRGLAEGSFKASGFSAVGVYALWFKVQLYNFRLEIQFHSGFWHAARL